MWDLRISTESLATCRFTCFKIHSYTQENILLLKIHLQSCSFLRCLPLCPCHCRLPSPSSRLSGYLSLSSSDMPPLSFSLSVFCLGLFCLLFLLSLTGNFLGERYISFLWKVLQLICLLKWQSSPFGLA